MTVFFTGAGPGDPELLTVKARRVLESARCCIWAGSLVNPRLLKFLPCDCAVHDSARLSLPEIIAIIRDCEARGIDTVRLHTGEPAIYGAIGEQMRELDKLGIPYDVIPGISAFQAAAAAFKRELTAPEVSQSVVITRTPGRTPLPAGQEVAAFARTGATLCLYLSAHKLCDLCAELAQHYGSDCPAAFIFKASWPEEQRFEGTLATLPALVGDGFDKTALLLVGRALAGGAESRLYAPEFTHGCREGTALAATEQPACVSCASNLHSTVKPGFAASSGARVLITGGATCEDIDPVRFLTNRSTGRMGVAAALAALALGLRPLLILGENSVAVPAGIPALRVRSAAQMLAAVEEHFPACDILLMTAAVADYTPAQTLTHKLKKNDGDLTLHLTRTKDILREISAHPQRAGKVVGGFSLDTAINLDEGRKKLASKNLDLIAVNATAAFAGAESAVTLLLRDGRQIDLPVQNKEQTAHAMLRLLIERLQAIHS